MQLSKRKIFFTLALTTLFALVYKFRLFSTIRFWLKVWQRFRQSTDRRKFAHLRSQKLPTALKLGVLGTGNISVFGAVLPCSKLSSVTLHAVASRTLSRAQKFAKQHNIPKAFGEYEQLLQDDEIQVLAATCLQ